MMLVRPTNRPPREWAAAQKVKMMPAETTEARGRVVVVGLDGSKSSSKALEWAAAEADLRGARLRAVRTWALPSFAELPYPTPASLAQVPIQARAALHNQLSEVLGPDRASLVEAVVREGRPAEALIDAAADADLIVVGSRGHGGFAGLLLGSVSSQVVHHAHCPVTIVR